MQGIIIILVLIILALSRNQLHIEKKLKKISNENSEYNKLYEENLDLHTEILHIKIENKTIRERNVYLCNEYLKARMENMKVPYSKDTFYFVKISNENLKSMFSKN